MDFREQLICESETAVVLQNRGEIDSVYVGTSEGKLVFNERFDLGRLNGITQGKPELTGPILINFAARFPPDLPIKTLQQGMNGKT